MKLISWNVNGIRACYKKGLEEFLRQEDPDFFCVQETKAHVEQLKDEKMESLFPHGYWSSCEIKKGYSGTCILSKRKLDFSKGIGIKEYDQEGRFSIAHIGDVKLYNVYFPNGAAREERHVFKQNFLRDFTAHLKKEIDAGQKIMLVGDYNVAHNDIDVHDPKRLSKVSGFLPEEQKWLGEFLEIGFVDLFRHQNPNEAHKYTWWSYRERARLMNKGWRIDYVCVSQNLKPQITRMEHLDQQEGSDHCPLLVEWKK